VSIVKELYVNAVLAIFSIAFVGVVIVFFLHKHTAGIKAGVFAISAAFVAMDMPYGHELAVFPHFFYYGAAYFGGWPALLLSVVSGQTAASLFGNAVVGMPRSVVIAGLWGLIAHRGRISPHWQEALVGLWPAALFLAIPGELPGEALLSAGGMASTVFFCWYLARHGHSYLAITNFLRVSGYVMLVDNRGCIIYTSPVLAQNTALAAGFGRELIEARAGGLGQTEVGEKVIECEIAGEKQVYLLRVSPLTLPMAEKGWVALFRDVTAIKSAQSQLEQFFALSLHGFAVLNRSGEILWVNQAVAQMLGQNESDLVGKDVINFIAPADASEIEEIWHELAAGRVTSRYGKVRVATASQSELWLSWSGVYSPTEDTIHVVLRNVHPHVERQERLVQQIEQNKSQAKILNLVHEAILVYDLSLGFLYANEAAKTLYGTDFSSGRGRHIDELLATRYPEPFLDIKDKLLTRGQWQGVISRTTRLGQSLIILARLTTSRNSGGDAIEIIEISNDYTAAMQDARRRKLLAAVVESTDDGVVSLAQDGTILTWNTGAKYLFGYAASDVLGLKLQELCLPESVPVVDAALLAARGGRTTEGVRDILPPKAGKVLYTSAVFSPLGGPEPTGRTVSMLVNDVTAQRLMEREKLRVDRVKVSGQIAAGLGHELRNSLTTVRGFLQLFRSYPDFAGVKSQLDIMYVDLMAAQKIVSSFMALAGIRDVERLPAQLNEVVYEAVPLLVAEGLKDTHRIRLELSEVEQLLLCRSCILQLVTNLARNGLQSMADGGTLTLATVQHEEHVLLVVSDEGAGIDPSMAEQLWEPFFTTRTGSAGLGLAVCENIAVLHHAKISYVSTSAGTAFTVAFPRELAKEGVELCN